MCAHVEAERRGEATCTRVRAKGDGRGRSTLSSDRGEANRGVDRLNDSDNDDRGRGVVTMEAWPWDNEDVNEGELDIFSFCFSPPPRENPKTKENLVRR